MPLIQLDRIGIPQMDPIGQIQAGFQQGYQNELARVDSQLAQRRQSLSERAFQADQQQGQRSLDLRERSQQASEGFQDRRLGLSERAETREQKVQQANRQAVIQGLMSLGMPADQAELWGQSDYGMTHLQYVAQQKDLNDAAAVLGPALTQIGKFVAGAEELDEDDQEFLETLYTEAAEATNGAQAKHVADSIGKFMDAMSAKQAAIPQLREQAVAQAGTLLQSFMPIMLNHPTGSQKLMNATIKLHQASLGVIPYNQVIEKVLGELMLDGKGGGGNDLLSGGSQGGGTGIEATLALQQQMEAAMPQSQMLPKAIPQPTQQGPSPAPQQGPPQAELLQGAAQAAASGGEKGLIEWAKKNGLSKAQVAQLLQQL